MNGEAPSLNNSRKSNAKRSKFEENYPETRYTNINVQKKYVRTASNNIEMSNVNHISDSR